MQFWNSKLGATVTFVLICWALAMGLAGFRVLAVTHPTREAEAIDFDAMRMEVHRVRFPAVDGPMLSGMLLSGAPEMPTVLLCHDLDSSKEALVGLAMQLNAEGFATFLFDFRGHGDSDGGPSTLGLTEKRDVLGALDYLGGRARSSLKRVGIYGVGMGAHAAVLAAADRPVLKVLVLDGLYPDPGYELSRRVFKGWRPAVRHLGFLPNGLFSLMGSTRIDSRTAAETVGGLLGRDMLLLAPESDGDLVLAMQKMYRSIPEQREVDGNLVVLPATQSEGLYGPDRVEHHRRVTEFFRARLPAARNLP